MNQMPFFFPPMWGGNQGNCNCQNNTNNLENQVNHLERQIRRLEFRVNRLEQSFQTPTPYNDNMNMTSTNNSGNNMYMM